MNGEWGMSKRTWLLLIGLLLLGSLYLTPIHTTFAAEDDTTAETEEGSSRGAGAVILMIGLAAIGVVGFAYAARQRSDSSEPS